MIKDSINPKQFKIPQQSIIQRRLKLNKKLANFNYRGERTMVVVSGLNLDLIDLQKIPGLQFYEERMLFFLFLLKYKKTKIIYLISKGFNKRLFDYYLNLISQNPQDFQDKKNRLIPLEVDDQRIISLTQKIINSPQTITAIKKNIFNPKTAMIRCYNPTSLERKLSLKLGIPLFASSQKFDYIGTKSGGRKVFKLSRVNVIPGFSNLKNLTQLFLAMAKLVKDYPYYKKLVVKLDQSASGKGNCIFRVEEFLRENEVEVSVKTEDEQIARLIRKNFCNYVTFQLAGQKCESYLEDFNRHGGITELYIPGEIKYSPSAQMLINASGKANVVSTHEQILGGPDNQEYLGCSFPAMESHRKLIIKKSMKIAQWMAKKGMVGNFSLDFVVVYKPNGEITQLYPIEINLRKGGATHPFRIAYYLTGASYSQREGILYCGKTPIYYNARDIIWSDRYKKIKSMELVGLVLNSKISFNKNTKRGVLVYMPGMVAKYGKFGAICIGHSRKEAELFYKRLIRLVDGQL